MLGGVRPAPAGCVALGPVVGPGLEVPALEPLVQLLPVGAESCPQSCDLQRVRVVVDLHAGALPDFLEMLAVVRVSPATEIRCASCAAHVLGGFNVRHVELQSLLGS